MTDVGTDTGALREALASAVLDRWRLLRGDETYLEASQQFADALLPTVRQIVVTELLAAAEDAHELMPELDWDDWLRDRADAYRLPALPALRDLIAERDQAVAAVERVRELAADYEGYVTDRGRPAPGSYDHGLNMAQAAAALDIRRALDGTP